MQKGAGGCRIKILKRHDFHLSCS